MIMFIIISSVCPFLSCIVCFMIVISSVVMINHIHGVEETSLSKEELEWQENRKRRKVKRLDFEIR